jgi:hypothetical protein
LGSGPRLQNTGKGSRPQLGPFTCSAHAFCLGEHWADIDRCSEQAALFCFCKALYSLAS